MMIGWMVFNSLGGVYTGLLSDVVADLLNLIVRLFLLSILLPILIYNNRTLTDTKYTIQQLLKDLYCLRQQVAYIYLCNVGHDHQILSFEL